MAHVSCCQKIRRPIDGQPLEFLHLVVQSSTVSVRGAGLNYTFAVHHNIRPDIILESAAGLATVHHACEAPLRGSAARVEFALMAGLHTRSTARVTVGIVASANLREFYQLRWTLDTTKAQD